MSEKTPIKAWVVAAWVAGLLGAGWLAFGGKSAYVNPPRKRR